MREILTPLIMDWIVGTLLFSSVYVASALAILRHPSGTVLEWNKLLANHKCTITSERVKVFSKDNISEIIAILSQNEIESLEEFLRKHKKTMRASDRIQRLKNRPVFILGAVLVGFLISSVLNFSHLLGFNSIDDYAPNIDKAIWASVSLTFSAVILWPHFVEFTELKDGSELLKIGR